VQEYTTYRLVIALRCMHSCCLADANAAECKRGPVLTVSVQVGEDVTGSQHNSSAHLRLVAALLSDDISAAFTSNDAADAHQSTSISVQQPRRVMVR
jgi:hypothetical protein